MTPLGPGLLVVVSGPSGAGKDTLIAAVRAEHPHLRYSVSTTTREPRPGERDGEHYRFVDRTAFEHARAGGAFLETREYNGNWYGTPRDALELALGAGDDIVMKPEVNGALAVKRAYPDAVLIFLVPERLSDLRERLLARRTETNEEVAERLEIAHREMRFIREFDYLVVNPQGRSAEAARDLAAILRAERLRIHRIGDGVIERVTHA